MAIFIVLIVILGIYFWKRKNRSLSLLKKRANIDADYISKDGSFHIAGTKDSFLISKNTRFLFKVKNGQIVSFVDREASKKTIPYGGFEHGNS